MGGPPTCISRARPKFGFLYCWLPDPGNCKNYIIAFLLRREKPEECAETAPRQDRRKLRRPPLVLAHEFQKLLADGVVNTRADIARRYGISRARVTQIMGLLRPPRSVQKQVLALPEEEQTRYSERRLRTIAALRTEAARGRAFQVLSRTVAAGPYGA